VYKALEHLKKMKFDAGGGSDPRLPEMTTFEKLKTSPEKGTPRLEKVQKSMKRKTKLENTVLELAATEGTYLNVLELLCGEFLKGITPTMSQAKLSLAFPDVLVNIMELHKAINETLQLITSVHDKNHLEESSSGLLDLLGVIIPSFPVYKRYILVQEDAVNELIKEIKNNRKLRAFTKKFEIKHRTSLDSMYLSPVQRLPRYVMLLNQISKLSKGDLALEFQCAKTDMEEMLHSINQAKNWFDKKKRSKSIKRKLKLAKKKMTSSKDETVIHSAKATITRNGSENEAELIIQSNRILVGNDKMHFDTYPVCKRNLCVNPDPEHDNKFVIWMGLDVQFETVQEAENTISALKAIKDDFDLSMPNSEPNFMNPRPSLLSMRSAATPQLSNKQRPTLILESKSSPVVKPIGKANTLNVLIDLESYNAQEDDLPHIITRAQTCPERGIYEEAETPPLFSNDYRQSTLPLYGTDLIKRNSYLGHRASLGHRSSSVSDTLPRIRELQRQMKSRARETARENSRERSRSPGLDRSKSNDPTLDSRLKNNLNCANNDLLQGRVSRKKRISKSIDFAYVSPSFSGNMPAITESPRVKTHSDMVHFLSPKVIDDDNSENIAETPWSEISRDAAIEDIVCVDSVTSASSILLPEIRSNSSSPSQSSGSEMKETEDIISVGGGTFELSDDTYRSITPENPIEKRTMPRTKKDRLTQVAEILRMQGGRKSLRI